KSCRAITCSLDSVWPASFSRRSWSVGSPPAPLQDQPRDQTDTTLLISVACFLLNHYGISHAPELQNRQEYHKKRDRERGARNEEWLIRTRLADRPRGEVAGNAGPPVGEQSNVHHGVADHAGNERSGGPSQQSQQNARAKHNGDHP